MMSVNLPLILCIALLQFHAMPCYGGSEPEECKASTQHGKCTDGTDMTRTRSSDVDKIRLGLEWFLNPDHLPLIVAKQHGIFDDFGLDVDLVEPADHWEAEEEILAGRLDVAVTEPLHLAQDAAKGKPVLGFSRFLHTDGGVMYDKSRSGIARPSDMCGKTISYPGSPGPGGPAIVQTMVEADGKTDCDIGSYGKYNGGFYHTDAIESGKADVAVSNIHFRGTYINATNHSFILLNQATLAPPFPQHTDSNLLELW